jgi:hypothetical protein
MSTKVIVTVTCNKCGIESVQNGDNHSTNLWHPDNWTHVGLSTFVANTHKRYEVNGHFCPTCMKIYGLYKLTEELK